MRHFFAVMASLLFFITACDQISMDNKTSCPQAPDHIQAAQLQDYVTVQVQPTTKPERYMVYFGWPRIEDQKRIRIRKDQVLATVLPNQTTFSHEVDHNQTITYSFDITDTSSRVEKSFSKQVIIPRDFVVRAGQSEFTENTKLSVNRFFLSSEKSLQTNGFDVEIISSELVANKGVIETFSEDSKATQGNNGHSAGNLKIKAKTASGDLKIYMRGQHGGDGLNGEPYSDRAQDGVAPTDGEGDCSCKGCTLVVFNCWCTAMGKPGGSGLNGLKGRAGHPGGVGGDSGQLKVEVQDGSAFMVETFSRVGNGGEPGAGGPGQSGGVALPNKYRCAGSKGNDGAPGEPGDKGIKGDDGKPGLICIYIASEGKNDCY